MLGQRNLVQKQVFIQLYSRIMIGLVFASRSLACFFRKIPAKSFCLDIAILVLVFFSDSSAAIAVDQGAEVVSQSEMNKDIAKATSSDIAKETDRGTGKDVGDGVSKNTSNHKCGGKDGTRDTQKDNKKDGKKDSRKPRILASSPGMAILVGMVVGDLFDIDSIHIDSGCPHHYTAKPSDHTKLDHADYAIYIDDNFEVFFSKMLAGFEGSILRVTDNRFIVQFRGNQGENEVNFHFWNSPAQVKLAMHSVASWLGENCPENRVKMIENIHALEPVLDELQYRIRRKISEVGPVMLLSRSIEPFFSGTDYGKLIREQHVTLGFIAKLDRVVAEQPAICLISDQHGKFDLQKKYSVAHVKVNAENWTYDANTKPITQYVRHIENIMQDLSKCRQGD